MTRAALCCVLLASASAALLPALQGVQGNDDQSMASWLLGQPDGAQQLDLRYGRLAADLQPGLRRYNFFWAALEHPTITPSATPLSCPSGYANFPANESERVRRGFAAFHCYSQAMTADFDDLLARDAAIGAKSALIMYGSPTWAMEAGCTGFPWPPQPNFRLGCLPWAFMDAYQDYVAYAAQRWAGQLVSLVVWNEVQSSGWSDPSPILPNRFTGTHWSAAQMVTYASAIANLTARTALAAMHAAALTGAAPAMAWLSTDHFLTAPPLHNGDVYHIGLYELLDALWPRLAPLGLPWAVAVHPYDAGDPRADLTAQGVYTFATLNRTVSAYQCALARQYLSPPPTDCAAVPHTYMWASEQGWPLTPGKINKTTQARNICYAHGLSLGAAPFVWSVTHNFFQGPQPSSQGNSGDFSLVDEPPICTGNLSSCAARSETYQAYQATAPAVYGRSSQHYCCVQWGWGCAGALVGPGDSVLSAHSDSEEVSTALGAVRTRRERTIMAAMAAHVSSYHGSG